MNDKINIPDWDSYFMKMVYLVAEKSKDPSTKVGAVLVKDNRIIATGYNGFPIGVDDMLRRYYDRELKYKFVVHAEHNAVLSCARIGVSSVGSTLYTQGLPCHECMKAVIQGGVSYIVVHKQWGTMSHKWVESIKTSQQMIDEVGISVSTLDSVLGINGYMDGKQFSV
jgi:dCMP deaminase